MLQVGGAPWPPRQACSGARQLSLDALLPQLGSTAIGVLTSEGVVLAVEKRITSPLLVRPCSHASAPSVPAAQRGTCSSHQRSVCVRQAKQQAAGAALNACARAVLRALRPVRAPPQEPSSIDKVAEIDEHIGCAMSGLTADAKTLIDHARADTQVRR